MAREKTSDTKCKKKNPSSLPDWLKDDAASIKINAEKENLDLADVLPPEAKKVEVVPNVVIPTNPYQTPITSEFLDSMPADVRDEFLDCIEHIPFIKRMISPYRHYAKDLERDSRGRIIVDIANPHILQDMDYFRQPVLHFIQHGCYTFMKPNGNPASEYYRWLKREVDRIWNGMVRPSDGEWIPGYMYFLLNYCPIMVAKEQEGTNVSNRIEGWSSSWDGLYLRQHYLYQSRYGGIYNDFLGGQHSLELSRRGAHTYDQKVPTPQGWKLWGDIKTGDELYGTHGNITKVIEIPFDGEAVCFEISLADGRTVVASDDHIWNIRKDNGKFFHEKTTLYIFNQFSNDRYYITGHANEYEDGLQIDSRYCNDVRIVGIRKLGVRKCKCVRVDAANSMYLIGDYISTHNCGKSYSLASMMTKNILFGENERAHTRLITILSAYEKEYFADKDGTLTKFLPMLDHCAKYTQFPRQRITNSMSKMIWQMGYKDLDTGIVKGSGNAVAAVSSKDNSDKLRGKRGTILFEEIGNFKGFLEIWNTVRESVEEGRTAFSQLYGIGTSGNKESDFSSVKEMICSPRGYNIYAVPNVWDKDGQGSKEFGYFFPSYMNRKGFYDKDGNSDVVGGLRDILIQLEELKHETKEKEVIMHKRAEQPVTPSDALLRVKFSMFPVSEINERLLQIANDTDFDNQSKVGRLDMNEKGEVVFVLTNDEPIRDFPLKTNKVKGAVEIFEMPVKGSDGKVPYGRYQVAHDPVDTDEASSTLSLSSTLVLDLWTDRIVAEYTGRMDFADDNFEILRRMALFYNASILYENNIKLTYSYFAKMNCTYMLDDTPEYLKEKGLLKAKYGNASKGVSTFGNTKSHADLLIRNWLLMPYTVIDTVDGEQKEVTKHNLYRIRNVALLKELAAYNPIINVDRIRALGVLMISREQKLIDCGGSFAGAENKEVKVETITGDPLFKKYSKYMGRSGSRFASRHE